MSTSTFNATVAEFFHDHHGIASTADLSTLDVGPQERRHLLDIGLLQPVFEGVYRLMSSPLTFHARCRAVCAADPTLVLCCQTAGTLLDLRKCTTPWLHAATARLAKPIGAGVKVHRTRLDLSAHIVDREDGIRHTDAVQTFFDLAKHVNDLTLRSIGEQIIADGLATHAELAEHVAATTAKGRPGSGRAARVIGNRSTVGGAAHSHPEVELLDALHAAGLIDFERQPPVRLRDGTTVHPDLGAPAIGFYIEVDHPTWHSFVSDSEYDKWRDREVRLVGGEVERVPTSQIESRLSTVVADLVLRYHQRCEQLRR